MQEKYIVENILVVLVEIEKMLFEWAARYERHKIMRIMT